MKSPTQRVLFALPLLKAVHTQFVPESEARLQAWRAYGTFVGQQLTAGVPLTQGKDFIYVTPPNLAAVRGGTPCPDSVTNFDLFALADGLQNISAPLLDTSGPSYIDSLYTYLQSVDLKTATPTSAQLAQLQTLTNTLATAENAFNTESNNAYNNYLADARAQATHQTFGSWVNQHDPLYTALQRQTKTANTALQNYETSLYGPQYQTLSTQRDKITNQADDELSTEPGAFFGLISASHAGSSDTTVFNQWTDSFSTAVTLKLSMKGLGEFNIGAGYWDVGNVRSTYSSLLLAPYGKDTLTGRVRLQKLLIGSEVGLTITINDSGMYKSVYQFIQDAKSSTGGGFSIFGFHFGGGGSSVTHRNTTDVTFSNQQEGGQIIIAPSLKGVPVMLGALGRAL
ncbi:hypothetical protein G7Y89_g4788 [Cudoniella acicularis]|uniref:Jacalin-type lectin domain-containing protein n=1 Tax=Cudoniella acicularis TaxID=354080 RepID=A0A8H4W4D4_9HELO|nr:hypothetical protein G7Y89_g4788 [Cudoniella acicularis]